jgi:uncharacterized small protein (TIGR04563 family)
LALIEKCKQALYFPEDMLREIQKEAHRQDRSMSWVVQQTWKRAHAESSRVAPVNDAPPDRRGVSALGDSPALVVVILRDGSLVGTEALPPGTYHVGIGDDCDLKLDDDQVSNHHATIRFKDDQVEVADEDSELGLFVNGEAVQNARVTSRDEVRLGTHVLKLRVVKKRQPDRAASAPAPEPGEEIGHSTLKAPAPVLPKEVVRVAAARPEPISSALPDLDPFGPPDP